MKFKLLVILLTVMTILPGCNRQPSAEDPNSSAKPTLVIVLGGLGGDQTTTLAEDIRNNCATADVVDGPSWDGYTLDVATVMAQYPGKTRLVIVGHSFGGEAAINDCTLVDRQVDLLVTLDAVTYDSTNPLTVPVNVTTYLDYTRANDIWLIPVGTPVTGGNPVIVPGGHNDVPHDATVIAGVEQAINALQ